MASSSIGSSDRRAARRLVSSSGSPTSSEGDEGGTDRSGRRWGGCPFPRPRRSFLFATGLSLRSVYDRSQVERAPSAGPERRWLVDSQHVLLVVRAVDTVTHRPWRPPGCRY